MKKLLIVMMLLSPSVYAKDANLSKVAAYGYSEYIDADMALYIMFLTPI